MKKSLVMAVSSALLLFSCGPAKEDLEKVCGCESLYAKMKDLEGEYQISDKISSSEAQRKVQAENQEAYNACVELHKDIGDDNYFKASQKCNSK